MDTELRYSLQTAEWNILSTVNINIGYSVEDINNSVRRTNILLRAANAVRLTFRDLNHVMKNPSFTNIMWTLIQISRTYNALRRLMKLITIETNKAGALFNLIIPEAGVSETPTAPITSISPLNIRTEAFLDNLPIKLDDIDLTNLPEDTRIMTQAILEEEAEITVQDARQILTERILHPEESTGNLAASIGWMSESFGVRLYANMYYAWWVEEGHDNFMGHHYMKDAFARTKLRLPVKLREQLNGLITNDI